MSISEDGTLPGCQAPDPNPRTPKITVPAKACDCHAHVFGPTDRFPYGAGRTYEPPEAPYDKYRKMLDTIGVERACLVQSSIHGTDNSAMLDAIVQSDGRFRGIAALPDGYTEADLIRLHDAGVRGARINLQFDGAAAMDGIERLADMIAPMGWHLQFLANIANYHGALPRLAKLPIDLLFDHLGHMPTKLGLDAAPFQDLLAMRRDGRTWVKLSGPYRTTQGDGMPFADNLPFAQALVAANPGTVVWGADWPHPHLDIPMVNDGDLVDLLADWVPDEALRQKILVDNPARLFGFEE